MCNNCDKCCSIYMQQTQYRYARASEAESDCTGTSPSSRLPRPPERPAEVPDILSMVLSGILLVCRNKSMAQGGNMKTRTQHKNLYARQRATCHVRTQPSPPGAPSLLGDARRHATGAEQSARVWRMRMRSCVTTLCFSVA
jgi:hypothetical protein